VNKDRTKPGPHKPGPSSMGSGPVLPNGFSTDPGPPGGVSDEGDTERSSALGRGEALLEVGQDVVDELDADGQPHQTRCDT